MSRIHGNYSILAIIMIYIAIQAGCSNKTEITDTSCCLSADMSAVAGSSFSGADRCRRCHGSIYEEWSRSGHAHIVKTAYSVYPDFISDVFGFAGYTNPPAAAGAPGDSTDDITGWDSISYIIGGYGWKALFLGPTGYILTGGTGGTANNQYNLPRLDLNSTKSASSSTFSQASIYPGSKYDCGRCHTTGWKSNSLGETAMNQDNLPGIDGTWSSHRVECERCHGNGSEHIAGMEEMMKGGSSGRHIVLCAPTTVDGSKDSPSGAADNAGMEGRQICADCHVRNEINTSSNGVETLNGYIDHHAQYNELAWSGGHKDLKCSSCHDPHQSSRYSSEGGIKSTHIAGGNCTLTCHKGYEVTPYYGSGKGQHTCVNCHMPHATKSAVTAALQKLDHDGDLAGGDVRTHIFSINKNWTDRVANMGMNLTGKTELTEYPSGSKSTAISLDFACMTCHNLSDVGSTGRAPNSAVEAKSLLLVHPVHK
jgi:hypothetical protein